jgi:hypothetical protein
MNRNRLNQTSELTLEKNYDQNYGFRKNRNNSHIASKTFNTNFLTEKSTTFMKVLDPMATMPSFKTGKNFASEKRRPNLESTQHSITLAQTQRDSQIMQ